MLWVACPSRPLPIADGKRRNSRCRRWRGRSPSAVSHADPAALQLHIPLDQNRAFRNPPSVRKSRLLRSEWKLPSVGAICGFMIGIIWGTYIVPWVEYVATHYHQCLYMRIPAPPFGMAYFPFIGSVESVTCPAGMG